MMPMKKTKYFLPLVLIILCFVNIRSAHAQLYLEEGKGVLSVLPGERVNKFLSCINTSAEDQEEWVYCEEFE